ncbi:MAG: hypothetical protein ACI834_001024 [Colwellia sp.]
MTRFSYGVTAENETRFKQACYQHEIIKYVSYF